MYYDSEWVLILYYDSECYIISYVHRWLPVYVDKEQRLGVMSIGFLMENRDDAVVWRGPKKNGDKLQHPLLIEVQYSRNYTIQF